jgi:hypothetical protein
MRAIFWAGVILAGGLTLTAGREAVAQNPADGAGMGGGQGRGQGGGQGRQRGAGGGGQMTQGTVTAVAADKVTIKTDAGDSYDVAVTADTRIMRDRNAIKLADVQVGDGVGAMGAVDAATKTIKAMYLTDVDAATMKEAKDNLGKTYLTGKITAIDADNLKLTVLRSDAVSQVIQVDEGTSFQRGMRGITVPGMMAGGGGFGGGRGAGGGRPAGAGGGAGATPPPVESITMADIKVGDSMMATGAVKGGFFIPVKMGVTNASAAGAGRRRPPADGAAPAGAPMPPPQ